MHGGHIHAVHARELIAARQPDRQLGPRLDASVQDDLLVNPGELRIGTGDGHGRCQQLPQRGVARPADDIEGPDPLSLHSGQHPGGQVPDVDVLNGPVRVARGEYLAATLDAPQPPGQSPHVLIRPEDQPGAGQLRPVAERSQHRELATALSRRVVLTAFAIRIRVHRDGVLVRTHRERPRVDRDA